VVDGGRAAGDGDKWQPCKALWVMSVRDSGVEGIKVTHDRHGLLTSRGIEKRRRIKEREREREGGQTSHRRKCDTGCPIMTPLPNTTDKTHGEWKKECGRQGDGVRERGGGRGEEGRGRQAAEGRGCDVTAQQRQRLPQEGQRWRERERGRERGGGGGGRERGKSS